MSHCQSEYNAWVAAEDAAYQAYVVWYTCEFGGGMAQAMTNKVERTAKHTGKSRYRVLHENVIGMSKEHVEQWTQLP